MYGWWVSKWRRCVWLVSEQVETLFVVDGCASGYFVYGW